MISFTELVLLGWVTVAIVMAVTWFVSLKLDNFSIVDSLWAFCFVVQAGLFLFLSPGYLGRKVLLFCVVAAWGLRLGSYLALRIFSHLSKEDRRYLELRKDYGSKYKFRFFLFFQYQAVSVSLMTIPFVWICQNSEQSFLGIEVFGAVVCALSIFFEALADWQMSRFKSKSKTAGAVCKEGLWKYSRHPNYFFEICVWWGFFFFALGSAHGWAAIYMPLVMTFLITKVTGLPMAERGKKSAQYEEYRKNTSILIPWFPKK
jgi:steroid 5-alpha reductase family enzyme